MLLQWSFSSPSAYSEAEGVWCTGGLLAGILFGLLLIPVLSQLFECLVNSFMQEPEEYEDERMGRDEVDEDGEDEKKER